VDIVAERNKKEFNVDHFIYSNYHLNYQRNVASEFLRMYYMMEKVSREVENFDEDVKGEHLRLTIPYTSCKFRLD
jgi:hypothetical protein